MKVPDPHSLEPVAHALRRAERALRRRPSLGLQDDAPASARWDAGTRVVTAHPDGTAIATDMPPELGGSGIEVSPGWLFRAALSSCAVTCIAMAAAAEGITLSALEVVATSRSDARGLFGLSGPEGAVVPAGPGALALDVRVVAAGVEPARLRALVERAVRGSPIAETVCQAQPLELHVRLEER